MVKTFLIFILIQMFLYADSQIILVISKSIDSQRAMLYSFENGKKIFDSFEVNIGKRGLGYGLGEKELKQTSHEPLKHEGDKKSPIGIFKLSAVFGYKESSTTKMPYLYADKELICVDDSNSTLYNRIIQAPTEMPNSFEHVRRDDGQYELGVVVLHNKEQLKERGSCIFLHVWESPDASTAGCTSMSFDNMKKIVDWLDKNKEPILIQIPESSLNEILELYPELKNLEKEE